MAEVEDILAQMFNADMLGSEPQGLDLDGDNPLLMASAEEQIPLNLDVTNPASISYPSQGADDGFNLSSEGAKFAKAQALAKLLAGDKSSDKQGSPWVTLGLALMASRNPNLLGAVGEAGLATGTSLSKKKDEERELAVKLYGQDREADMAMRKAEFQTKLIQDRQRQQAIRQAQAKIANLRAQGKTIEARELERQLQAFTAAAPTSNPSTPDMPTMGSSTQEPASTIPGIPPGPTEVEDVAIDEPYKLGAGDAEMVTKLLQKNYGVPDDADISPILNDVEIYIGKNPNANIVEALAASPNTQNAQTLLTKTDVSDIAESLPKLKSYAAEVAELRDTLRKGEVSLKGQFGLPSVVAQTFKGSLNYVLDREPDKGTEFRKKLGSLRGKLLSAAKEDSRTGKDIRNALAGDLPEGSGAWEYWAKTGTDVKATLEQQLENSIGIIKSKLTTLDKYPKKRKLLIDSLGGPDWEEKLRGTATGSIDAERKKTFEKYKKGGK